MQELEQLLNGLMIWTAIKVAIPYLEFVLLIFYWFQNMSINAKLRAILREQKRSNRDR